MARGRPRKDGSKPKEKEVEPDPDPEVILEGARTKRKAATACIKSVMNRYNITPSDVKKDDTDQLNSDNDNSSKLVKSPSGDNDLSDPVSKLDDTASVSGKVEKNPDDACEKCDVISAEKPSPSKNWTQSIWGSPNSSGSVVKPPPSASKDDPPEERVLQQEICSVEAEESNTTAQKQPSSSSGKKYFDLCHIPCLMYHSKVQPPPRVVLEHPEVRPPRLCHQRNRSPPSRKVKPRSGNGFGH